MMHARPTEGGRRVETTELTESHHRPRDLNFPYGRSLEGFEPGLPVVYPWSPLYI